MDAKITFSLWIIPAGEAYRLTESYIARLSAAYGLPRFEPHVTVLGSIPSPDDSAVRALAAELAPFPIRLMRQVEYLDEYFRCLFLRAHETDELMEAISEAGERFGPQAKPHFPHLSLAYGDLTVETKQQMIRELGEIPEIEFEAQAISLVQASSKIDVSSWKVVERFPFAHP